MEGKKKKINLNLYNGGKFIMKGLRSFNIF